MPEIASPRLIPAKALAQFAYCPRLGYLEWVQSEFEENEYTLDGERIHARVDQLSFHKSSRIPDPEDLADAAPEPDQVLHAGVPQAPAQGKPKVARAITLSSETHGLIARLDIIEHQGKRASPVDYKRGKKPDIPGNAWFPNKVQVAAQALILRDNGFECTHGVIYYAGSKDRVEVEVDDDLVAATLDVARRFRAAAESRRIPPPLVNSPKCVGCSLAGICLPDETLSLATAEAASEADSREDPIVLQAEVRRLIPPRHDSVPLYVQHQGSKIGLSGEELHIWAGGERSSVRLLHTSQICVFGSGVQISTQAVKAALRYGIPICYFSYGGWFQGMVTGPWHKNVEVRIDQYKTSFDQARSLALARAFVRGKILNQRTLLRRNARLEDKAVLKRLKALSDETRQASDLGQLLGIEGTAARLYFENFRAMLKVKDEKRALEFYPGGRNRRPPKDPVNAMLSFGYSMLTKDLAVITQSVGFDPLLGFFHQPRYGRPALALDLMEEFRPIVVDSVVITTINRGEITIRDFFESAGTFTLKPNARKTFIHAYERRMDELVTHPIFRYRISYKRIMEVQARLLARHISGELENYVPFTVR